jgi:hypothetical protein
MTNATYREILMLKQDLTKFKDLYHDLIMGVGNKWPGETRHQTARRYILEAETLNSGPDAAQGRHNLGLSPVPGDNT